MKKNSSRFIVIFSILLFLSSNISCTYKDDTKKELDFNNIYPSVTMNEMITLEMPKNMIGGDKRDQIRLFIHNDSQEKIGFPVDFGIKVFSFSDQTGWIEIQNLVNYSGKSAILEPKGNGIISLTAILIRPNLIDKQNVNQIRVVVVGKIFHNDLPTNVNVGAFMDINLD